ncbi:BTB/POZ and MATH domain-containing protein 2-like [Oryza brachyantha]|uniref:BTB domain-containing protein n=1 Tax=Oryza brachyantha TaxID=4533 RepID=J3MRC0_ORYBR|nr:BTB/POZ and MATH domain-containing protein 2-like [Oryza brachyantha]
MPAGSKKPAASGRGRPEPGRKTVSTCSPDLVAEGVHVFDIFGYSDHRGMGTRESIRSGAFSVGGLRWVACLYLDGYGVEGMDYVSAYLRLVGDAPRRVWVSCEVKLLDRTTGLASTPQLYLRTAQAFGGGEKYRVLHCLMLPRPDLEVEPYLVDDRLTMEFHVTVKGDPRVSRTRRFPRIQVPPPDIKRQLGKLLHTREGADVTFDVAGEAFPAHKLVLAMRSPVFKAELCGPLKEEAGSQPIAIVDMQPAVFRALLEFIYTDQFPTARGAERGDDCEMIRHLLVAADRYAVDRLKLLCQSVLCKNLNVHNVATTLALADQHQCDTLKDACIEFVSSSRKMQRVVASKGYVDLQRTSPSVLADAMAQMSKFNKMSRRRSTPPR